MANPLIPKNLSLAAGGMGKPSLTDKELSELARNQSTIRQSDLDKAAEQKLIASGMLILPSEMLTNQMFRKKIGISSIEATNIDPTLFSMRMQETDNEAIQKIVEEWQKGIEQQAILSKEEELKRYQQGLDPKQLAEADMARVRMHSNALPEPLSLVMQEKAILELWENTIPRKMIPDELLAAACIITAKGKRTGEVSATGDTTSADTPGSDATSSYPIDDDVEKLVSTLHELSPEELEGFISTASLFINLGQYASAAETFPKTVEQLENRAIDRYFARRYAENMVVIITSPEFGKQAARLMATFKEANGEPFSKAKQQELFTMMQVTLLITALALTYKVDVGGNKGSITAEEMRALILGEMNLPQDDIKTKLGKSIRTLLYGIDEVGVPFIRPKIAERLLQTMFEYLESNPKLEELARPIKVSLGLLDTDTLKFQAPPLQA
jgi:hypothetical protein